MISNDLFKMSAMGPGDSWFEKLDKLASLALAEKWSYNVPRPEKKNQKTPILENYILHTFRRIIFEYNAGQSDEDKQKILFMDEQNMCFNTGLFTKQYENIYAIFRKNRTVGREPWFLIGFSDTSHPFFRKVKILPRRAQYFTHITDLVFDTSAELRVNSAHILSNPENISRLPMALQGSPYITMLFEGAVSLAKKKVQANYKAAVPQFYDNQVCFLLPICLQSTETADISLAVRWHDGYYTGHTCLTLDMAYNNARLIACPNSEWLKP